MQKVSNTYKSQIFDHLEAKSVVFQPDVHYLKQQEENKYLNQKEQEQNDQYHKIKKLDSNQSNIFNQQIQQPLTSCRPKSAIDKAEIQAFNPKWWNSKEQKHSQTITVKELIENQNEETKEKCELQQKIQSQQAQRLQQQQKEQQVAYTNANKEIQQKFRNYSQILNENQNYYNVNKNQNQNQSQNQNHKLIPSSMEWNNYDSGRYIKPSVDPKNSNVELNKHHRQFLKGMQSVFDQHQYYDQMLGESNDVNGDIPHPGQKDIREKEKVKQEKLKQQQIYEQKQQEVEQLKLQEQKKTQNKDVYNLCLTILPNGKQFQMEKILSILKNYEAIMTTPLDDYSKSNNKIMLSFQSSKLSNDLIKELKLHFVSNGMRVCKVEKEKYISQLK